jgi:ubiquitin-conjugating enzyme E2 S
MSRRANDLPMQTISCLLIHPNPDSALNSAAGALLQEDYEAFAKQARLMTSIHAPIPASLREAVLKAKRRGEEHGLGEQHNVPERPTASTASSVATSAVGENEATSNAREAARKSDNSASSTTSSFVDLPEDHEEDDDAKENDLCHSASAAHSSHESSRRHVLGKRPLSELPTPIDLDAVDSSTTGAKEKASHGQLPTVDSSPSSEPVKKSPKLDISARHLNTYGKLRQEDRTIITKNDCIMTSLATDFGDDKENVELVQRSTSRDVTKTTTQQSVSQTSEHPQRPTLRKVSNVGSSRLKGQARVGIRRL